MNNNGTLSIRLPDEVLAQLDEYTARAGLAWGGKPRRAEVMRRLIELALAHFPAEMIADDARRPPEQVDEWLRFLAVEGELRTRSLASVMTMRLELDELRARLCAVDTAFAGVLVALGLTEGGDDASRG